MVAPYNRGDYRTLCQPHGSVFGKRVATPNFVPLPAAEKGGPVKVFLSVSKYQKEKNVRS